MKAIIASLLPIMWSHGAGADVMKRIAAPMIGGVITSFLLELIVYPVIFEIWREWEMTRAVERAWDGRVKAERQCRLRRREK